MTAACVFAVLLVVVTGTMTFSRGGTVGALVSLVLSLCVLLMELPR